MIIHFVRREWITLHFHPGEGGLRLKKIVICEDHNIVYDGLALLLNNSTDFLMAGYAPTGKELKPLLKKTKPDILILDLNLPDTDGFILLREVRKDDTRIKIIILTMYNDHYLIAKAKEEGADAYILKNTGNQELMAAMNSLDKNKFYVTETLQKELDRKKMFRDRFAQKMKLTQREVEIIRSLAMGHSSEEIAAEFFLSHHTVETHRKNIFRKLEINNNIGKLIRFAHDNHIL